jgi:hypothetical protein
MPQDQHCLSLGNRSWLKRLVQAISQRAIQEVPPELEACQYCRKSDCSQNEWLVCEDRIGQAKRLAAHQGKAAR